MFQKYVLCLAFNIFVIKTKTSRGMVPLDFHFDIQPLVTSKGIVAGSCSDVIHVYQSELMYENWSRRVGEGNHFNGFCN